MAGVSGGKLLVMGGFVTPTLEVTSRVDLYDPSTDSWAQSAPLPAAQTHVAVAQLPGEEVVLAGGFVGAASSWHTTAEVWIRAADGAFRPGPALSNARAGATAVAFEGLVHVVGGLAADGNGDLASHEAGPLSAAFQPLPALPNPRNHLGGAAVGGLLYAVGGRHGWDELGGNQPDLHAYDPVSGQWAQKAPLPQAVSEIAGATFAAGGRLFVVGGSTNGAHPAAAVFSYDPASDSWSHLPDLPGPRKGAAAAYIGNRIIVSTGSPTSIDPAADTWVGCCLR